MVKVLPLEGPHKKHHNHGSDASMPMKGKGNAIPSEHWERTYRPDPAGNQKGMREFDPMRSKDRPSTHNRVNESDH